MCSIPANLKYDAVTVVRAEARPVPPLLAPVKLWSTLSLPVPSSLKTNCVGTFRLAENQTQWDVDAAKVYGLAFKAVEAF